MAEGDAPIARECVTTGHLGMSINQFEMSVAKATRMLAALSQILRHRARSVPTADVDRECRCAGENLSGETIRCWIDIVHFIVVTRISIQIERKRNQHSEQ